MGELVGIFGTLTAVMKTWMFYQALWMNRDPFWAAIVMVVPLGEWMYFFKLHGFPSQSQTLVKLFKRPPSLQQLQYELSQSPSVQNKLKLGLALIEKKQYSEAIPYFEQVLLQHPQEREALWGITLSMSRLERWEEALPHAEQLAKNFASYKEYTGALLLSEILWNLKREEECFEELRKARGLCHKVTLAKYLSEAGKKEEAKTILSDAMSEYKFSPSFIRKTQKPWAKAGKTLLASM